jgi:hypothetical protein
VSRDAAPFNAHQLLNWSRGLFILASHTPARLSLPQAAIFLLAATCDSAGQAMSITRLRETLEPLAGHGIKNSYQIFLELGDGSLGRLGWLRRVQNPLDAREKFLKLTPKGKCIINKVLDAGSKRVDY